MNTRQNFITLIVVILALGVTGLINRQCFAAGNDCPTKGLVMHLSFDTIEDVSGQKIILDESGNENHGTLLSGKIVEGKIGNAFKCQAINKQDGIRVKDNDSLDLDAVTMAVWIKTQQIDGQWNRILDKGWTEGYNLCLRGDYKGEPRQRSCAQLECAMKPLPSKTPVVDNQWHLVVGTYDGKTLQLFIDGKLDSEKILNDPDSGETNKWKTAAPMKHNDVDIMIGRLAVPEPNPYDHAFFDGLIDEVRLYNRVLSAKEVEQLYHYRP